MYIFKVPIAHDIYIYTQNWRDQWKKSNSTKLVKVDTNVNKEFY